MIMRVATFLLVFVLAQVSFAKGTGEQYLAYLISSGYSYDEAFQAFSTRKVDLTFGANGLATVDRWSLETPVRPGTSNPLPSLRQSKTIIEGALVAKEIQRQASKPLEQRQYENAFFELTEQVLTLSSDERAGQTPPVKLGFDELNALLEALFDTDMANATKLSIKLLSIDSALKRYNTLWWEDAIQHVLPEE